MKNKGFTIIELGISFCIVSVISIVLFQLILSIKDLYLAGNIKTNLLNKQGIMTKRIYDDIQAYDLKEIKSCGISCLEFTYNDKQDTKIEKKAKLSLDPYNTTVTYDDYTIKLENGTTFGKVYVNYDKVINEEISDTNNRVLQIKIPIYNQLIDGDFGINIVIQYNDKESTVNNEMNIDDVYLTLNEMDIPVKVLYETTNGENVKQGIYAKVFYHNIDNGNSVFASREEYLRVNEQNKFSVLFALKTLKGKYHSSGIDSFEFLLYYPSSVIGGANNYNHWIQTNNFARNEILSGYEPIDIMWNANGTWDGLDYADNDCTYVDGIAVESDQCYFSIGAKQANNGYLVFGDNDNEKSQDVELWARIDDYVNKYSLSQIIFS